jgi:hypothetical protein
MAAPSLRIAAAPSKILEGDDRLHVIVAATWLLVDATSETVRNSRS